MIAALSVVVTVAAAELFFRLIRFDLSGRQRAFESRPIFYRMPTVPTGSVFFRRPGPAQWSGNVLSASMPQRSGWLRSSREDPYADLADVTIEYDREGFRNPLDLDLWKIVVVGDSFTELGYLPYEDLFTTRLAQRLGVRVKNLGVSFTGPLTHVHYLETYGASSELRHAVWVFFEGNDLDDLRRERAALRRYEEDGERIRRDIAPETSLVGHLAGQIRLMRMLRRLREAQPNGPPSRRALFRTDAGEVEVTISYLPPSPDRLGGRRRSALREVMAQWAHASRRLGSVPWLVYMPCKRRVLDGHLRFIEGAADEITRWSPTDLPGTVRALAQRHGIRFIDLTPGLAARAAAGQLSYNPVWDTHLDRDGSHRVGELIAEAWAARWHAAPQ